MFRFYFRHIQRGLMVLIIGHLLNACTSMESRLSIEPYIKDKQKRNAVEWMAERYCRKKRNYPQSQGVNNSLILFSRPMVVPERRMFTGLPAVLYMISLTGVAVAKLIAQRRIIY